jgi:predicted phosphoadenosine phosphosulfate sulfurtransferase
MKNLLVSFSGGETSAFMAQWIKANLKDNYQKNSLCFC